MASKKEIKNESLIRLRELLNVYGTVEKVKESDKYKTTYTHFLNKYEKENIDMIFDMLEKDSTDTEIREAVKESIYRKKDPVATETENVFVLNKNTVENKGGKKEETKSEKKDNVYSIFIKTEDMADTEEDDEELETSSIKESVDSKDESTDVKKESKIEEAEVKETIETKTEKKDNNSDNEVFSVFGIDEKDDKSTEETSAESEGSTKQSTKERLYSFFKKIPTPKKKDSSESEKKEKSIFKKKEKPAPITLTFGEDEEEPTILNVFKHDEIFSDFLKDLNTEIDNIMDGKEEEVKEAV